LDGVERGLCARVCGINWPNCGGLCAAPAERHAKKEARQRAHIAPPPAGSGGLESPRKWGTCAAIMSIFSRAASLGACQAASQPAGRQASGRGASARSIELGGEGAPAGAERSRARAPSCTKGAPHRLGPESGALVCCCPQLGNNGRWGTIMRSPVGAGWAASERPVWAGPKNPPRRFCGPS